MNVKEGKQDNILLNISLIIGKHLTNLKYSEISNCLLLLQIKVWNRFNLLMPQVSLS